MPHPTPPHPMLAPGRTAVVTGAASGIGRAAARRFAAMGLRVALADLASEKLDAAGAEIASAAPGGAADVLVRPTDVSAEGELRALKAAVDERFGGADVLMNNAARMGGDGGVWGDPETWSAMFHVNLFGVVHGVRVFGPDMIKDGQPRLIINTGSKQGVTNPPGNAAYNATKAAVKSYTEGLQHSLRSTEGCRATAHLLIPGWTTTGDREHRPGAWRPEQVIDFMLAGLERGDFYILCPDDETSTEMDHQRILWAAGDIVENRPPLSRWHPDWKERAAAACS